MTDDRYTRRLPAPGFIIHEGHCQGQCICGAEAEARKRDDAITYEPTRDHWTPYEPWMRDVLTDDARVSWLSRRVPSSEHRNNWGNLTADSIALVHVGALVHPNDVPERPTAREHIESERLGEDVPVSMECRLKTALDSAAAQTHRARKAEAERDEWQAAHDRALGRALTRDKEARQWKAKHDVLRGDVERMCENAKSNGWAEGMTEDILRRDADRGPQS